MGVIAALPIGLSASIYSPSWLLRLDGRPGGRWEENARLRLIHWQRPRRAGPPTRSLFLNEFLVWWPAGRQAGEKQLAVVTGEGREEAVWETVAWPDDPDLTVDSKFGLKQEVRFRLSEFFLLFMPVP